ncbi:MAG: hypothetical protein HC812_13770 [Leptolyngbya sp. RL_3_1]|nr:hypothetical protein [Leptolyngbya sp. RL_3_1]
MPKLDICDLCLFYTHNPYLVCAIHPTGAAGESCLDFRPNEHQGAADPLEWWEPEGASYYGDELVIEPLQRLTNQQRLELLDTHPMFTGRCPNCEMPIRQTTPARVHWDCERCGWVDDSV